MTPEEQRSKIAEACGWNNVDDVSWIGRVPESDTGGNRYRVIHDYLNDLNAMHEAEKVLGPFGTEIWAKYARNIRKGDVVALSGELIHATAAQRAEAFLKTLGLWKEEEEVGRIGGGIDAT